MSVSIHISITKPERTASPGDSSPRGRSPNSRIPSPSSPTSSRRHVILTRSQSPDSNANFNTSPGAALNVEAAQQPELIPLAEVNNAASSALPTHPAAVTESGPAPSHEETSRNTSSQLPGGLETGGSAPRANESIGNESISAASTEAIQLGTDDHLTLNAISNTMAFIEAKVDRMLAIMNQPSEASPDSPIIISSTTNSTSRTSSDVPLISSSAVSDGPCQKCAMLQTRVDNLEVQINDCTHERDNLSQELKVEKRDKNNQIENHEIAREAYEEAHNRLDLKEAELAKERASLDLKEAELAQERAANIETSQRVSKKLQKYKTKVLFLQQRLRDQPRPRRSSDRRARRNNLSKKRISKIILEPIRALIVTYLQPLLQAHQATQAGFNEQLANGDHANQIPTQQQALDEGRPKVEQNVSELQNTSSLAHLERSPQRHEPQGAAKPIVPATDRKVAHSPATNKEASRRVSRNGDGQATKVKLKSARQGVKLQIVQRDGHRCVTSLEKYP